MTASSLPITKSHFLQKLHERQIKHLEWEREMFEQQFDELEKQVAQPRGVSNKREIEQAIGEVKADIQIINMTLQEQAAFALREKTRLRMESVLLTQEAERA